MSQFLDAKIRLSLNVRYGALMLTISMVEKAVNRAENAVYIPAQTGVSLSDEALKLHYGNRPIVRMSVVEAEHALSSSVTETKKHYKEFIDNPQVQRYVEPALLKVMIHQMAAVEAKHEKIIKVMFNNDFKFIPSKD